MIIEEYILFVSSLRNDEKFTKRKFKIHTSNNTGDANEVDRADQSAVNNSVMEKKKFNKALLTMCNF